MIFALFVFVVRLVCPMMSVSLTCQILAAPSVFSNVYLQTRSRISLQWIFERLIRILLHVGKEESAD